jgi:hypothetical protein
VECGGEDEEEPIRETAADQEAQDDERALMRRRVWENYVEGEWHGHTIPPRPITPGPPGVDQL